MRYCQGCGAQLPEGAVFCPSCGRSVNNDTQGQSQNTQNGGARRDFNSEYCQNDNRRQQQTTTTYYDDTERYSAMTILGLIFAFVSSLVGLILSILAYNEAKRTGSQKNMSLSKTGITLSAVFLGIEAFAVILVLVLFFVSIFAVAAI